MEKTADQAAKGQRARQHSSASTHPLNPFPFPARIPDAPWLGPSGPGAANSAFPRGVGPPAPPAARSSAARRGGPARPHSAARSSLRRYGRPRLFHRTTDAASNANIAISLLN